MKKFRDFIAKPTLITSIGGALLGFIGSASAMISMAVLSSNITAPFVLGAVASVIVGTGGGALLGVIVGFAIAGISYLVYKHFSDKKATKEIDQDKDQDFKEQTNLLSSQALLTRDITPTFNITNDINEIKNKENNPQKPKKEFSLFNLFHRKSKENQSTNKHSTIVQPLVITAESNNSLSP